MPNTPPTLTGFNPSITLLENDINAAALLIYGDVDFVDPDDNFNGGTPTLTGLLAEDRAAIRNQGIAAGRIGVSGSDVTYGGVVIDTFAGGVGGTITVTFNASATSAAIDALTKNLTYANVSNTPTASRTLVLNVTDAEGADLGPSGSAMTISVTAPNEAPINTVGGGAAGTEDTPIALTGVSVSDVDSDPALDNITVHLSVARGTLVIRTDVVNGITASHITGGGQGTNGITLTATQNQINATLAAADGLTYQGDLNFNGADSLTVSTYNGVRTDPINFASKVDYSASANPIHLVTADVNGDGILDLVYAGYFGQVGIRLGNGDGTFQAETLLSGANNPVSVAVADLNNDGIVDIAVANYGGGVSANGRLGVHYGTGGGAFGSMTIIAPIPLAVAFDVVAADLNHDGRSDLIVAQRGASIVKVFIQQANGTLVSTVSDQYNAGISNYINSILVGDFNNDGNPDLVTFNPGNSGNGAFPAQISLLLGNANGTFQPLTSQNTIYTSFSLRAWEGVAGDFDGDGNLDLAWVSLLNTGTVQVMFGNGTGLKDTFDIRLIDSSAIVLSGIKAGDVNGDGRPDLIAISQGNPGSAFVLINNGDRTFQPRTALLADFNPESIAIGDFDGDGDMDFAVDNQSSNSISVFLNQILSRGDIDTKAITVSAANDAPSGANATKAVNEDGTYTFAASDFGFTDPDGHALASVTIATLPAAGILRLSGVAVTAGQEIAAASLGQLTFAPAANANGTGYASFTFQVRDTSGSDDLDLTPNTITFNVNAVNDAPAGADNSKTINEDSPYTFAAADFGFTDPVEGHLLAGVRITTLPTAGILRLSGVAVTAGQTIAAASIGNLTFTPAANASGSPHGSFTFQVQDNGGTASGGVDLDPSANSFTFNVTAVNDPPSGGDATRTFLEDSTYTFAASDFGFTDPDGHALASVIITTLPAAGTLRLNGIEVTQGQEIAAASIGQLTFAPAANANGTGYAAFTFQVRDTSGSNDLDASANTITFNVTAVNDAPSGADATGTIDEDSTFTFAAADFGFSDPDGNSLLAVKITTLPGAGTLRLNGVAVTAGQSIAVADIGNLTFTPAANANGAGYADFTFQVQDNGGTANSGLDTDQSPNAFTFNVTPVNETPTGADATRTILEDSTHIFAAADFGFTDTDGHALASVMITTLPAAGTLRLNGVAVTAGQEIAAASLGQLTFEPAANANGAGYAAFTFQVRDTSGSNDLDPSPNTITFNVTAVNDAPSGADATRTIDEDSTYTFAAADFGFSDPDGNSLLAVKITTLPGAGTLRLNGIAVTAGQSIAVADIPTLTFAPAANANGAGYAAITFQVQDNGGTADGGVDLDQSPNTISFDVTAVNDAPSGADATRTIDEDSTFTFAAADFGFSDPDGNSLLAVKITTLPGAGTLRLNGVAVTAGQSIAAADIGNLTFTPAANANGASYAGFTFQVQDNGGTANSGLDTDQSPNAFTFNVTPVNDAPTGADATRAILEDSTYTFAAADFGFTDTDGHALASVIITTLPAAGTLRLNGVAVTAGQEIAAASLGQLTFEPAANANGAGYAAFTFQVRDNSGSNDLDASPNTFSFDVTAVNDAPSGADLSTTRSEDGVAVLTAFSSIGFSDPDGHSFAGVVLTTLPTEGGLYLNDVLITAPGTFISAADIDNLLLRFRPDTNESGSPYTSFTYQVRDNGGTANGGQDTDQSPNSFTFHITPVNDAPSGADATRTMGEDTTYTFAAVDFGFSDPVEGHGLLAVKITTLPTAGTLRLSGAAVTAGQSIAAADIGNLTFTPAANANGAGYAGFTFQVQDNGGTGGGGVDLDQSPNSFTFNVDAVNDAPTVSLATGFTVNEQVTTSIKNLFSVGDVDSGSGQLSVDIWFDYGIVDSDPTGSGVIVSGIGSSGVRITGTVAQISEFLANPAYTLTFTYQDQEFAFPKIADNPPATLAVHMSVSDNGFTGAGGEQIVTADGSIAIIAVNDAPAGTAAARTIAEDSTYTFAAADFGFTDVDGNSLLAVKITTLPGAGTLRLNGTAVTAGQVIAVADIPSLTFTPAANANGTGYASFSFQVQDNGGTANNGVDLDQSANSFTFNVTAVADPPLNSVPGAQNGTEDANLVFSAANGNAISIGDPESSSFTVTLGVTHGTLTLGSVVGLGSVTGNGGASVIVTGTAAAINAAFNGLIYRGNLDYNGPDTLSVLTSDGALSDSDTVAITLAPDSHIDGTPGNDTLNGTGGNDTINGRAGNDTITGGAGNDTMSGGLGNDVYNVDSMSDVVVELAGEGVDEVRTNQGSKAPPDRLVYVIPDFVENLTGTSAGAQGVRDNALDNVIVMGAGHDLVVADAGGVDNINGGGGNDFIYFGDKWTGADIVNGGAGVDTISMIGNYASGNSIVFTATNLVGIERMAMYSGLYLGATPFSYNVTTHDSTVAAGTEFFVTAASLQTNETLTFNGSAETNGRFTIHGGAGADLIAGGSGNDFFLGRGGNDQLFGGGGADFLIGGLGADQLTGGAGNDVFRFQATNESVVGSMDSILDFQTGDKIDLGAIDANSNVGGNQSFAFIGSQAFHNVAGELRVFQNAGTWFVETDVNGDGAADMIIGVTSAAPLTAGDFIL